jgi:DNA repair protein RecO (recombination protein O)
MVMTQECACKSMPIQRTQGFVIRREDIRETSVLLTAYTRDFGKIRLISKGMRVPEQKFVSSFEPLALNDIVFYERRKDGFFLLSQCELVDFFLKVRTTLEKISYATYCAELLDAATPFGEVNARLYALLSESLGLLSDDASPKRVARIFEIKLLSILGLMPRLKSCCNCDNRMEKGNARFSFSLGGILCESCRNADKASQPILAGTINFMSHIEGMPFERIKNIKVSKRVGNEVEKVLRRFIDYHLDIKLKSVSFMSQINV